jgi:putative phosphoribosyl transferase
MDYHHFRNRVHAGRLLAARLMEYAKRDDVIVLALPRGGVPVAFEIAVALEVPLDVFLVRKLGVPGHEELAMGAIAPGGIRVLNEDVVDYLGVSEAVIDKVAAREQKELDRRAKAYREDRPARNIEGKTVIVVDDGLATGSTMHAATDAIRKQHPARVVVAVPVAALATYRDFESLADEIVSVIVPQDLDGIGRWYEDFSQTSDDEVRFLLKEAESLSLSPHLNPPKQERTAKAKGC